MKDIAFGRGQKILGGGGGRGKELLSGLKLA